MNEAGTVAQKLPILNNTDGGSKLGELAWEMRRLAKAVEQITLTSTNRNQHNLLRALTSALVAIASGVTTKYIPPTIVPIIEMTSALTRQIEKVPHHRRAG